MNGPLSPSERAAIDWEVRLRNPDDGDAADALAAFARWRAAAPDNETAWNTLQCRLARLRPGDDADGAAIASALRSDGEARRRLLRSGFKLGILAFTGVGATALVRGLGIDADWRSGVGERRSATLADGSVLTLDAGSRVYRERSAPGEPLRLRLAAGQLALRAAAGARYRVAVPGGVIDYAGAMDDRSSTPNRIIGQAGATHDRLSASGESSGHASAAHAHLSPAAVNRRAAAVDTLIDYAAPPDDGALNVGLFGARSLLAVEGGVATLRRPGRPACAVTADQGLYFGAGADEASALGFDALSSWTRGLLVAERMPLAQLLEVFNRYGHGLIRAGGDAARRRISGVFHLDDIERALRQAAETLHLPLTRYGPLVTLLG